MKKLFIFWVVLLCLAVTACSQHDGSQTISSTSVDEQSNSNSVSTNEETSAIVSESVDSNDRGDYSFVKLTGEVIPIVDQTNFSARSRVGTRAELEAWYQTIVDSSDDTIAKITISDIASSASELAPEQVNSIMQILKNAQLKTYSEIGNPATGGTVHIVAYDLTEKVLWHVSFDDFWFTVEQENDGNVCVFDGEGTELIELKKFA